MAIKLKYIVYIDNGNSVDSLDLDPNDDWETLEEFDDFINWMADNPQAWVSFQTVGPEVRVPVSRIVSIYRLA